MYSKLITLKLILDCLEIPAKIDDIESRKLIQKSIYLTQIASGVDLGYRFGWYRLGPYCPELAVDYNSLNELIEIGIKNFDDKELDKSIKEKICKALPLMYPPTDIKLTKPNWLELLASIHFLYKISGYKDDEVIKIIKKEKPNLFENFNKSKEFLKEYQLL